MTASVIDSSFSGCTATDGAGVALAPALGASATGAATLTVQRCAFDSSVAQNSGGGVTLSLVSPPDAAVSLRVENSTFASCAAPLGGGVVYTEAGQAAASSVVVQGNSFVDNNAVYGGGLLLYWMATCFNATATVTECACAPCVRVFLADVASPPSRRCVCRCTGTFLRNVASDSGGAIGFFYADAVTDHSVAVTHSAFRAQQSETGGAVVIGLGAALTQRTAWTFADSTFTDNVGAFSGGAIAVTADLASVAREVTLLVQRIEAARNRAWYNNACFGGALNIKFARGELLTVIVEDSSFVGNSAPQAGSVSLRSNSGGTRELLDAAPLARRERAN